MSALQSFHFLRPAWLLLLLLLPVMPWLLRRGSEAASLRRLVDARLLPYLVEGGVRRQGMFLVAGAMLGWTLACLALAGPTWQRMPQPVYASRSAQVIAVSMSRRMLAQDLPPDRLTRVRYKVQALLKANKAGQNGLIAYAGASFTVAPLTTDVRALTELIRDLSPDTMPVPGDNAASAIRRATRLLRGAGMHQGSIVLIDDHADTRALDAARAAHAAGMRVSVLGVGTAKGAPVADAQGGFQQDDHGHALMAKLDASSLRALATAGGGRYIAITPDNADIHALASQLRVQAGMRDARHEVRAWKDQGVWLLLPLLLLVAVGFRRGVLLMLPWVLLPLAVPPAHASGWQDAWRTRDQQAARALASGQAKRAQQLARDPSLRGTAAYRAGDYRAAARAFAEAPGARNMYNRGNALARMHRYREAIKAYDRALAADPKLGDARSNRKAIREWLKHHSSAQAHGDGHGAQGRAGDQPDKRTPPADKDGSRQSENQPGQRGGKSKGQQAKGRKQGASGGRHEASKNGEKSGTPQAGQRSRSGKQGPRAKSGGADDAGPSDASPSSADRKAQEQARRALKKQLERKLGASTDKSHPYALGRAQGKGRDDKHPLPAAMRDALDQVPDDPGGLLRNKFMLEYQRRLQRGDSDVQPDPDGGQ